MDPLLIAKKMIAVNSKEPKPQTITEGEKGLHCGVNDHQSTTKDEHFWTKTEVYYCIWVTDER